MRLLALLLLALLPASVFGQATASVSGYVEDAASGETLLSASVTVEGTLRGVATNNAGYYTLMGLEPGTYALVARYLGYEAERLEVTLEPGEEHRLDFALTPVSYEGREVVVTAEADEEEARAIGVTQLSTAAVRELPAVFEPDVFRSLQLLPGIKSASDYSAGLYIRGGSPDQTLILLDRTTVYSPSHFFGFFSTFNPDAIKDVRLYKGGYPAEYGGRLGSVLDIYNKDGNRNQYAGTASLGLLASRVMVEGPLPDGDGAFMFAARRSTLEPLLAALDGQDIDGLPESFYFYDVNAKVTAERGRRDRLSVAGYAGRDKLLIQPLEDFDIRLDYGNVTLTTTWTRLLSDRLFSTLTGTFSRYTSEPEIAIGGTPIRQLIDIDDVTLQGDLEFVQNERLTTEAGFKTGRFGFTYESAFDGEVTFSPAIASTYADAYVQQTWKPTSLWELQGGLRASYFSSGRFLRLAPRLSAEYRPTADVRLQAGYGRYNQPLQLIAGAFSGFDFWLTADEGVPPSYGDQFVAGVKSRIARDTFLDVEVYYRTMRGLFDLDPFLPDAAGLSYSDLFFFGEGYATGFEVLLNRQVGRLNGFVGYTLGLTRRRYENLNRDPATGEPQYFTPKYDRTHDVTLVTTYNFSSAWRLSAVFSYATGQAYTQPLGQARLVDGRFSSTPVDFLSAPLNNARLPAYHRLDVGVTRSGRFFGVADYEAQAQVINLYGRENIFFYDFQREEDGTLERVTVPQIPIPLPNLSLTLFF